jgi:hypothetical protein
MEVIVVNANPAGVEILLLVDTHRYLAFLTMVDMQTI